MFNTILWATDGSERRRRRFPIALGLAEPDDAKLVIAHVREIFVGRARRLSRPRRRVRAPGPDRASRSGAAERGRDATFIVRTSSSGHAARTIAEIAEEVEADLIVVGTHGYGRVAGLLLGSVTQGLLHAGICPVLAVPTGAPVEAPAHELETAATQ